MTDGSAQDVPPDPAPGVPDGETRVDAAELTGLAAALLAAAGVPAEPARAVAASLVEADLVGHGSHGVRRLPAYLAAIADGVIDPAAAPVVAARRAATAVIDGRRAFGQLAARRAADELTSLCEEFAAGVVTVRDCNHVGRLGEYAAGLAERGLVAIALSNADPTVAPHGGRERRLGTNPLAWALPRAAGRPPVVMDWATAAVAEGKLGVARARGQSVPPGLLLDAAGAGSTDPADFYRGGALLPFGGHKGYGLSVVIEIAGGLLSGAGISSLPGYGGRFGTVMIGVRVDAFVPLDTFRTETESFCAELAGTPLAEGHREVLVPGEPEERARARHLAHGVPLPSGTWRRLLALRDEPGPGQAREPGGRRP
ncbi:Ldh family oxidoreductase [Streptomyces sp. MP131-18]|uniref:Ldh family oxidoreductase n=1 Tax=Streptomyces sp. MP131-18 TaxID=1857892 RepID=UPI0009C6CB7F|nr:Ldh family oxidoreductase [Streptomyces sp. MP131-18]ONK11677.1 putative oxidoreductase YjmC [Streptomyces sp. MP131-18]